MIERRKTIQTNFYSRGVSRRSLLKASATLVGMASGTRLLSRTQSGPLVAYVGTFSSPLRDTLPTQVDLPPGNGRGIHLFDVDRASGELNAVGHRRDGDEPELPGSERRTNAPLFRERNRSRRRREAGQHQRILRQPHGWQIRAAQHRSIRRRRSYLYQRASRRTAPAGGQLLRWLSGGASDPRRRAAWRAFGCQGRCWQHRACSSDPRAIGQLRRAAGTIGLTRT